MENVTGSAGMNLCAYFDSIENMDELLKQMDQEIIKYNRNNRYYLSITRGVSFLKDTEGKQKKISDWKYEADQDMYCNKRGEI